MIHNDHSYYGIEIAVVVAALGIYGRRMVKTQVNSIEMASRK